MGSGKSTYNAVNYTLKKHAKWSAHEADCTRAQEVKQATILKHPAFTSATKAVSEQVMAKLQESAKGRSFFGCMYKNDFKPGDTAVNKIVLSSKDEAKLARIDVQKYGRSKEKNPRIEYEQTGSADTERVQMYARHVLLPFIREHFDSSVRCVQFGVFGMFDGVSGVAQQAYLKKQESCILFVFVLQDRKHLPITSLYDRSSIGAAPFQLKDDGELLGGMQHVAVVGNETIVVNLATIDFNTNDPAACRQISTDLATILREHITTDADVVALCKGIASLKLFAGTPSKGFARFHLEIKVLIHRRCKHP